MTRLSLPFPPSTNTLFENRRGGRHKSKPYEAWLMQAGLLLNRQPRQNYTGTVAVDIALRNPNAVRRDADNRIKAVLDLLVNHGVIAADDHTVVRSVTARWVDEGEPCVVTIEQADRTSTFFKDNEAKIFAGLAPAKQGRGD